MFACERPEFFHIVKFLVENGAKINSLDEKHNTALTVACERNDDLLVSYLLDHGANPNIGGYDRSGTSLNIAVSNGNFEIVKALLMKKAKIDDRKYAGSALISFIELRNKKIQILGIMDELIKYGAKVNRSKLDLFLVTGMGTPLEHAWKAGFYEAVQLLVANGADKNLQLLDRDGEKTFLTDELIESLAQHSQGGAKQFVAPESKRSFAAAILKKIKGENSNQPVSNALSTASKSSASALAETTTHVTKEAEKPKDSPAEEKVTHTKSTTLTVAKRA